jgi:hypothetical protein
LFLKVACGCPFRPGGSSRFRRRLCPGIGFMELRAAFMKAEFFFFCAKNEAETGPWKKEIEG